jgi:hypothetical protein
MTTGTASALLHYESVSLSGSWKPTSFPLSHSFSAQTFRPNTDLFLSPSLSFAHSTTVYLSFLISLFPFSLYLHRSCVFFPPYLLPHASQARPFVYLPSCPSLNYSTCPFTPSLPRTPPNHLDQPHSIYGCMRIQYSVEQKRTGENKCIERREQKYEITTIDSMWGNLHSVCSQLWIQTIFSLLSSHKLKNKIPFLFTFTIHIEVSKFFPFCFLKFNHLVFTRLELLLRQCSFYLYGRILCMGDRPLTSPLL